MNTGYDELIELLTGALARDVGEAEVLPAARRRELLGRVRGRIATDGPPGTTTVRTAELDWEPFAEGIRRRVLRDDLAGDSETVIYELRPGAKIEPHAHHSEEECLVLDGELWIGDFIVRRGDFHLAAPGTDHPPMVAPHGAVLLIRSQRMQAAGV